MSKKGFQYGKSNQNPEIAMPSEGEVSAIEKLTNPGAYPQSAPAAQSPVSAFGAVPEDIPEETRQAMNSMMQEEEEVEDQEEEVEEEQEEEIEEEVVAYPVKKVSKIKTKEDNFAELRNARERAEREKQKVEQERDAFMSQMLALQAQVNATKKKEEPQEDYDIHGSDEDLAAVKDVRKADARTRALEKKIAQMEAQSREAAAEARVRSRCPDIDSVVNDENIYLLRQNYPDVAQSLATAPDSWDKLASVYTMIKTLGIHKTKAYESDKMKAVNNVKKPRPMASISPQQAETPLSKANAFVTDYKMSKEAKENAWKEMKESMKGV